MNVYLLFVSFHIPVLYKQETKVKIVYSKFFFTFISSGIIYNKQNYPKFLGNKTTHRFTVGVAVFRCILKVDVDNDEECLRHAKRIFE